jgi:hypothetical protein
MSDATARSTQRENLKQADLLCGIGALVLGMGIGALRNSGTRLVCGALAFDQLPKSRLENDPETSHRATECQRVCSLANGALLGLPDGHRHCSRDRILEGTNPCLNGQEERN